MPIRVIAACLRQRTRLELFAPPNVRLEKVALLLPLGTNWSPCDGAGSGFFPAVLGARVRWDRWVWTCIWDGLRVIRLSAF